MNALGSCSDCRKVVAAEGRAMIGADVNELSKYSKVRLFEVLEGLGLGMCCQMDQFEGKPDLMQCPRV